MPQLRQNIITGEWVVIAPERAKRPSDFIATHALKTQVKSDCVFCVGNKVYTEQRLKGFETEHIYVIPNSYPAFLEDAHQSSGRRTAEDFYHVRPATGGHDVLIVKDHDHDLLSMSEELLSDLLKMAKRRYVHWRHDRAVNYTMLIYNHGSAAGASIAHPHAQVLASNILPNQISRELSGSERYYEENGSCVYCDIIKHEQKKRIRIIEETEHYISFTFYAARFPFETWVLPKKHQTGFEQETDASIKQLSHVMRKTLARLNNVLQGPSLNFYLHDSPTTTNSTAHYHWHLEIAPRVSNYGGYELGSGTVIDVMSPEVAAEYLQKATDSKV